MAKTTLNDLLRLQNAGGVLYGGFPGASNAQNWDQFVAEHFDLSDPEMVEFLAEWKRFNEANARWGAVVLEQMTRHGFNVTA